MMRPYLETVSKHNSIVQRANSRKEWCWNQASKPYIWKLYPAKYCISTQWLEMSRSDLE